MVLLYVHYRLIHCNSRQESSKSPPRPNIESDRGFGLSGPVHGEGQTQLFVHYLAKRQVSQGGEIKR
jgi:hypothetical protein